MDIAMVRSSKVNWRTVADVAGALLLLAAAIDLGRRHLPRAPFVEISSARVLTPDVAAGTLVKLEYTMRRNRACPTVANLRYGDRNGVYLSHLTRNRPAIEIPVSEAFVVVPRYVPTQGLDPGDYTYQPLYTCKDTGEQVEPPVVTFRVR